MSKRPTNVTHGRPPKEGVRQLFTLAAVRSSIRAPRWFLANLRQGPEWVRSRQHPLDPGALDKFGVSETTAGARVLGLSESRYRDLAAAVWIPEPDPHDPLAVWNARREMLRLVGVAVRELRPAVVVETGVARGFSSATILAALRDHGNGRLHSIDLPAIQYETDVDIGAAVPLQLRHGWDLRLGDSRKALPRLLDDVGVVDLFLHDAAHTYGAQFREYRTVWPYLRPGGLLISDDINNSAFLEFADSVSETPVLVSGGSRDAPFGVLRRSQGAPVPGHREATTSR